MGVDTTAPYVSGLLHLALLYLTLYSYSDPGRIVVTGKTITTNSDWGQG